MVQQKLFLSSGLVIWCLHVGKDKCKLFECNAVCAINNAQWFWLESGVSQ